jgi:succinate dehydrogenase (ubiquinone) membrane anchor subunit
MLGVTGVTILGLLKLNLTGPGITETYKSLWREPPKEEH